MCVEIDIDIENLFRIPQTVLKKLLYNRIYFFQIYSWRSVLT